MSEERRSFILEICDVRDRLKADLEVAERMLQIVLEMNKHDSMEKLKAMQDEMQKKLEHLPENQSAKI